MSQPRFDLWLLVAVLGLCTVGVVMVYSASGVFASERLGDPTYFLGQQLFALGLGLLAMVGVLFLGHERLMTLAPLAYLVALGLLLLLFVPGLAHTAGGATRWLRLGPLGLQPSEIAKPALVLYLAWSLARKGERVREWRAGFLGPVLLAGLPIALILVQPDLGTAASLVLVVGALLFMAGTPPLYLLAAGALAAPVGWWLITSTPWRMRRIVAFLDPWGTRDGAGYQVAESLISIGSGGAFGVGLGESRQKLFFLPEAHTDFIFSIIGEELGWVGSIAVLLLCALLLWRGFRAAFSARDAQGTFLALGLTTSFGLQALLNTAVATGLVPTKGLTLPFISYGGSSLVLSLAAAGLLLSVSGGEGGYLRRSGSGGAS